MATHEFGIMDRDPRPGEWYSDYQPEKYHCVYVDDAYLEEELDRFADIPCYWQTLDQPGKGLDYCGVTLIPPESIPALLRALRGLEEGFWDVIPLLDRAAREKKFVIHFGI